MIKQVSKWSFIDIVLIALTTFTIVVQIFSNSKTINTTSTILYFVGTLIVLSIIYFIIWLQRKAKHYISRIKGNTKTISKIDEKMSLEKKFYELKTRLSILENKKGVIDPKWPLLIIALVLFYLYIRSVGLVP